MLGLYVRGSYQRAAAERPLPRQSVEFGCSCGGTWPHSRRTAERQRQRQQQHCTRAKKQWVVHASISIRSKASFSAVGAAQRSSLRVRLVQPTRTKKKTLWLCVFDSNSATDEERLCLRFLSAVGFLFSSSRRNPRRHWQKSLVLQSKGCPCVPFGQGRLSSGLVAVLKHFCRCLLLAEAMHPCGCVLKRLSNFAMIGVGGACRYRLQSCTKPQNEPMEGCATLTPCGETLWTWSTRATAE